MTSEMRVTLEGDRGEIGAEALQAALGNTIQLLKDAASVLGATAGRWVIEDLAVGSATFMLANSAASGVTTFVSVGLEDLTAGSVIPVRWTQRMVRSARDLGRIAGVKGVQGVVVDIPDSPSRRMDGPLTAHADAALETREVSIGSVSGFVDRWQERKGHQIGLTLTSGETLTATYDAGLSARVLTDAVGRQIEAFGEVHRNSAGQRVNLIMSDFAVVEPTVPIGINQIAGLYADLGRAGVTANEVLEDRT